MSYENLSKYPVPETLITESDNKEAEDAGQAIDNIKNLIRSNDAIVFNRDNNTEDRLQAIEKLSQLESSLLPSVAVAIDTEKGEEERTDAAAEIFRLLHTDENSPSQEEEWKSCVQEDFIKLASVSRPEILKMVLQDIEDIKVRLEKTMPDHDEFCKSQFDPYETSAHHIF